MSGVEILGIAAAVLQIADLGAKVSVKLFGFARKVRGAAEKIDMISKEIAATGALLQQLSAQLDKDSQAQLLRRELIESADDIVRSCKEIFKNIDKAIDGNSGSKIILGFKQRIHYTYLESEIDALRTNLESLKNSISIMQNVLIYAEQLRNRERFPVLKEQQDLLKALGEEKLANERRYDELMRAIEKRGSQSQMSTFSSLGQPDASFFAAHVALGPRSQNLEAVEYPHTPSSSSNNRIVFDEGKLRDYISLVACIIEDIHSKRYKLDKGMRLRVQDGVLDLHWQEWAAYRQYYSDDVLLRKFRQLPELVHFWVRKIEEERRTDHVSAGRASSTSDLPQPNIIINADVGIRGRGRGRVRARSRSRGRRYHDDDIVEEIIERRGREGFRTPSPYHRYDYETQQALERLKVYEQETAEAQEVQKKYKADLDLKKAKEQLMKAEAEEKRKIKYKDAEIAEIMERRLRLEAAAASSLDDLTYTRLPRKYVSFQTLNVFDLDWELDEVCRTCLFAPLSPDPPRFPLIL